MGREAVNGSLAVFGTETVKPTWVTRRIAPGNGLTFGPPNTPGVGDLLLCEVTRLGIHGRVETADGARMKLYSGDRIVCAVGNRYATSLLEAVGEVDSDRADLVSASGVCGRVTMRNRDAGSPTKLRVLGQAFRGGVPFNLREVALAPNLATGQEPKWVVVVGSSMDSGKTTACASLIRGLTVAGQRVAAIKLTGTASARDFGSFRDASAFPVLDFLDAGWASTAGCNASELAGILDLLANEARCAHVDWGVIEIADGLLQPETAILLGLLRERLRAPQLVLTVGESLAAVAGVERLLAAGHDVRAIAGLVTNSPLGRREIEGTVDVPCVPTSELGRRFADGTLPARTTRNHEVGGALV